jgi:hypothetical protein
MRIEELAVIVQHEDESIRNEMATREELEAMGGTILRSVERVGQQLSMYDSRWSGEFDRLAARVHEIEGRMSGLHPP